MAEGLYLLKLSGSRRVGVEGGVLWRGRVLVFGCLLVIRLLGTVQHRVYQWTPVTHSV